MQVVESSPRDGSRRCLYLIYLAKVVEGLGREPNKKCEKVLLVKTAVKANPPLRVAETERSINPQILPPQSSGVLLRDNLANPDQALSNHF
jgi:hypothetical protein